MQPGDPAAVRGLFESVAPRYDQLNDALSLGLHRLWKRQVITLLRPSPGQHLIDLCCGTGDLALMIGAALRPGGDVLGLDAASAPLAVARRRAAAQPWLSVRFQQGDALATGLPDGRMDGASMAYGLRNLADPAAGLAELRRILRPGARAVVLDFRHLDPQAGPQEASLERFQRWYLRSLVVPAARLAGLEREYAYLQASIDRFPTAETLCLLARRAGFRQVRHRPIAAGLMGVLELVA
ncbi:MAG: bifunctional demethylmenaquinone methyltransferase/2-methoxy-6-polyprenyl-1,4-benzoquinol methylase UbiE [Cyanobium sp.]